VHQPLAAVAAEDLVVGAVVVAEENSMNVSCQLCHKITHIDVGKVCKTCGMILEDGGKDFCSRDCRNIYERLKRIN
jgi:hypothetical protein